MLTVPRFAHPSEPLSPCRTSAVMNAFVLPTVTLAPNFIQAQPGCHHLLQRRRRVHSIRRLPIANHSLDDALSALNEVRSRREDELQRHSRSGIGNTHIVSAEVLNTAEVENTGVRSSESYCSSTPTVYLVGTGPGDPGLLTLRAVELMRNADVVLYDRLVSPEILNFVGKSATMIYVGKEKSFHTRSQSDIHTLLREFAFSRPSATVIRLKGGDPFVFGRGGEEIEYLEKHGVRVRVIPGITAAAGIGAELGIPLTHRGLAHSVRFLTGHMRDGLDAEVGDMPAGTTLVIYMGLSLLRPLLTTLSERGLTPETPAVAVERGTTPEQRTVWAPARQLADKVEESNLKSPTLVIIGDVVGLAPGFRRFLQTGSHWWSGLSVEDCRDPIPVHTSAMI